MDQQTQCQQSTCNSEDLSQVVNSVIENLSSKNYCVNEISITKGNNIILFKINKNSEDDFQQVCKGLLTPNTETNATPCRATSLSPLNLNTEMMLSPCIVLSTEQQKLQKWKHFYQIDEEGNYRCLHCPTHKKFTTRKWLVHHLDQVAKRNTEN